MTNPAAPAVLRTRKSKTWSSFGNLGRKPSDYEVVTHNMNHTVGAVPLEMGPQVHGNQWLMRHRDSVALRLDALDAFRDPDQMTYRKYTQAMDQQETYIDGLLQQYSDVVESDRTLSPDCIAFLASALSPARYLGHGLQMISAYLQQLARSSYVANCAAFQTADQLRRVQRVAYRTRQLANAHPEGGFGTLERATWQDDSDWQPLRKAVEKLMVTYDWDEAFVALNLVVKPLVDELFLRVFAAIAREHGDELDALIAENLFLDAQRSRRWTVDACQAIIKVDGANAEVLRMHLSKWRPYGLEIINAASRLLARHAPVSKVTDVELRVTAEWTAFLSNAGLELHG